MKLKLMAGAGLVAALLASNAYAFKPQTVPSKNEGTPLETLMSPAAIKSLGLPGGCVVGLPNTTKGTPRVAKVAARMSAWIGDQTPDLKLPRVYLHREGDKHVFLRGPAIDVLNMGVGLADTGAGGVNNDYLTIKQRETADGKNEGFLAVVDHTNDIHYIRLANLDNLGKSLKSFEDGPLDGSRLGKMAFRVDNARPTKKIGQSTHHNADSYTVTALYVRLGGALRVFGLCM